MARGSEAKEKITQKIIEIFGQDCSFEHDKKLYINTTEGGSPIQICITMTCPKTPVGNVNAAVTSAAVTNAFDAFGAVTENVPESFKPAEITPEERQTVQDIMKRLGL